ncbi:MAG: hypothetical protein J0L58_05820 [Burkholderiales bacterium]|nr:hypothetical protein [Burkholderiales bacterium]
MNLEQQEIAAVAARLIAEEGLPWGAAKQRAVRELGLGSRIALPDNDQLEDALREHLALFQADSQPAELRQLRLLALRWMDRLAMFEPLLVGAAWRGTANRLSDLHLDLFSDDPKAVEIALINAGETPEPGAAARDARGAQANTLVIWLAPPPGFQQPVALQMNVQSHQAQRGSLLPDARGTRPRGNTAQVRALLEESAPP